MKKLFLIQILFICAISICLIGTGCKKSNVTICDCGKVEINKTEYVAMCILPYEVSINSPSTLIIENHTKKIMHYGRDYSLEYFNENNWELIPFDDAIWEDIYLGLGAGETIEDMKISYPLDENYKKGKYRIVKSVSLHSEHLNNDDVISINLYAEFEIK